MRLRRNQRCYSAQGKHLVADFEGVPEGLLRDSDTLCEVVVDMLEKTGMTILQAVLHKFPAPGAGLTGFYLLAESHCAFHTYPEHGYFALDLFTCGDRDLSIVIPLLAQHLMARSISTKVIARPLNTSPGPQHLDIEATVAVI